MSDSFQRSNLAQSMEAQRAEVEHALTRSPFRIYADRMGQQGAKTINILQVAWILRVKRGCETVFTRLPELLASGERLAKDLRNLRDDGRLGVSWREYIRDAGER
ncbi:alpha/beta hydrolase, partial [Bradyrhizobium sp. BRP20]|nr:alpha/beta hydrolase [Bradyrhizobium sp. BRP20]MCA1473387.1 alpha/beta hydrolase [Bradyrhizobium sp. IC3195]MCA1502196.1 alpha/beta hydrolase [Bradyrhizobium sp. NBAIM14]MCA1552545.1 alpha/beta hydrolase [Bradyrhizobium sp. BRP19]